MSSLGIYVAIFNEGVNQGIYKHWAVFIDGPNKTILNALGSSTRYYFDMSTSDPRESEDLIDLIHMWDAPVSKMTSIVMAAESAPIYNEYPGYNCQDYVLELLSDLEAKGIIDCKDAEYKKKKAELSKRQEGLE
ncbi:hypothetical protein N7452_000228 [Penicillium brevicompactum]|uniref:Uncharacterized protein n=1 Tax=Penicillium brevicompactum TaxID=5074 RepID=A0A9W9R2B0_PENBR|nr:hypothetical protein N7452_000228 [Penicillium brevicompactum]